MHETPEDLAALQRLLDESAASAGEHLRSVCTPERALSAPELCDLLTGVNVLALATVSVACEPRVAPVDGLFYRGAFWFGSSPDSVRFRHLRARPAVSASHTRGEELAVSIHGRAAEVDINAPGNAGFLEYLRAVYSNWDDWAPGSAYARIDATRMFVFALRDSLGLEPIANA